MRNGCAFTRRARPSRHSPDMPVPMRVNLTAGPLGVDYSLDLYTQTNQAMVGQATPATCASGGSCYTTVGAVALTVGTNLMAATVPLTMLGNATGRLNFRVFAYVFPQATLPTPTADVMPDIALAPAIVQ